MFLHPRRGLMSQGPTAQTVNGDITVRAPGLPSSAVPVMGLRPRELESPPGYRAFLNALNESRTDDI